MAFSDRVWASHTLRRPHRRTQMPTRNAPGGDTPQSIGLQLAMAFGQGAGPMHATPDALVALYEKYRPAFERKIGQWPGIELQTLAFARAAGFGAAVRAAQNGRAVIDVEDALDAIEKIRRNKLRPLIDCSLTPFKLKAGDR